MGNLADIAEIDVPQSVLIKGTKAALQDIASVREAHITGITNNAKSRSPCSFLKAELSKNRRYRRVTIENRAKQFGLRRYISLRRPTKGKTVNTDVAEVIVSSYRTGGTASTGSLGFTLTWKV